MRIEFIGKDVDITRRAICVMCPSCPPPPPTPEPPASERLSPGPARAGLAWGPHSGCGWRSPTTASTGRTRCYQSLEPAHRLVFGYGMLAWEFIEGARNWALPGAGGRRSSSWPGCSGWTRPAATWA